MTIRVALLSAPAAIAVGAIVLSDGGSPEATGARTTSDGERRLTDQSWHPPVAAAVGRSTLCFARVGRRYECAGSGGVSYHPVYGGVLRDASVRRGMHSFVKRVVPLFTTAVVIASTGNAIAPAGDAMAVTPGDASSMTTSMGCVSYCFDILNELQVVENYTVAEVVAVCPGVPPLQLFLLKVGQVTKCTGGPPGWGIRRIS
jgi:hypothetical protein